VRDVWVVGGICRDTKECFLERVIDRTRRSLHGIIQRRVAPGPIIITDYHLSYDQLLAELGEYDGQRGYAAHFSINHTEDFARHVNIDNNGNDIHVRIHTNTI